MNTEDKIIVVDGPIFDAEKSSPFVTRTVYSVTLSSGMIITSPEGFDNLPDEPRAEMTGGFSFYPVAQPPHLTTKLGQ